MRKEYLYLLLLTVFSIFIYPGYEIFSSDQLIYAPAILHQVNNNLYTRDVAVTYSQTQFTLFDEIIALLLRLQLDLYLIFFVFSFITRFFFFFAIFKLGEHFFQDSTFSLFLPLLFLTRLAVYGTETGTTELELHPRIVALTLCLWYLVVYFRQKKLFSLLLLGSGMIIHLPTAIPFLSFHYLKVTWEWYQEKKITREILMAIGWPLVFFTILFFYEKLQPSGGPPLDIFTIIDSEWMRIILERSPFTFISRWGLLGLANFFVTSILLFYSRKTIIKLWENKQKDIFILIAIPLTLGLISFIFADIFKLALINKLLLPRSFILLKILTVMIFGYHVLRKEKKGFLSRIIISSILLSLVVREGLIFIFLPSFLALLLLEFLEQKKIIIKYSKLLLAMVYIFIPAIIILISPYLVNVSFNKTIDQLFHLIFSIGSVILLSILLIVFHSKLFSFMERSPQKTNKGYFIIIITTLLCIIYLLSFPSLLRNPIEQDQSFMQVCQWVKSYTSNDDLFLLKPDNLAALFRIYCQRNVFVASKDGGQAMLNREYALVWKERMGTIKEIDNLSGQDLKKIAHQYNIQYFVAQKKYTGIPLLFSNSQFYIYKLQ